MEKRAVMLVAHGDDETNGAGGTLFRLKEAGWQIRIAYATLPTDPQAREDREKECVAAATYLGAEYEIWGLPDGAMLDNEHSRKLARTLFESYKPTLIIGLHGLDVHPDHRAASSLALGQAMGKGVNIEYFTCELCSSGRHTDGDRPQTLGFLPTHYVDTSEQVESGKVSEMTHCHASQDPDAMVKGGLRVHHNRALETGETSVTQAEAFVRLTRVGELDPEIAKIFVESPFRLPRPIGCDFKPENIGIAV